MLEWAIGLDIARVGLEIGGVLVEATVDMNMPKFPVLKVGFMILRMVTGEGCVMVATCPPDLSLGDDNLFLLSQGRRGGKEDRVL